MENSAVLNVRISEQLKQQLDELSQEKDETVSDYVRGLLTKHVLQDSDSVLGMSPELMKQIEVEAKRRNIPTSDLITRLIISAFARLRKNTSPNLFILE